MVKKLFVVMLVCIGLAFVFSCDGGDDDPQDDIFAQSPDPSKIETIMQDGREFKFPVNQLVILMEDGATEKDASAVASAIGANIVGQIPSTGTYQLELPTTTAAELEAVAVRAEAQPKVESASYNYLGQLRETTACKANDDNDKLTAARRCALENIQYYQAVPIVEKLRSSISFSKVKVAVLDSGLDGASQFENTSVNDLVNDNGMFLFGDDKGHGTQVAGIIAADNGDNAVNGIASRIVGASNIGIYYCGEAQVSLAKMLSCAAKAGEKKIDAVNMSFGYGAENPPPRFAATRSQWVRVMAKYPGTLYLAAADNKPYVLTLTNDAPAGIQLGNMMTVGGVGGADGCDPVKEYAMSARGSLIDIAAPAVNVPVLDPASPDGTPLLGSGNSFAAPIVTSIAAVIKSINPALKPSEIKKFIMDYNYLTSSEVNYRRAVLALPLEQMLINKGAAAVVLGYIDRDGDRIYDEPGVVVDRICSRSEVNVESESLYVFESAEEDAGSFLNAMGFGVIMIKDGTYSFSASCSGCAFKLDTDFPIPAKVGISYVDNALNNIGSGTSGALKFISCVVVQREGLSNMPLLLDIEGTLRGVFEVMKPPSPDVYIRPFTGKFNLFMVVMAMSPSDEFVKEIEKSCHGGLNRP